MTFNSLLRVLLAAWTLLGASALADAPPNALTEPERRSGWRLLFDGRSPEAFRGYRRDDVPAGWVVEEGTLVRRAAGAGDLITRDTFEHFELLLDYRIAPGGNSGVMFHVTEAERAPWMTGPEVQILDNAAGKDPQKAGWLYQLYEPRKPAWLVDVEVQAGRPRREWLDATRPAGEWNQIYLRVAPDSGEVSMNGVSYVKFRKGDEEWAKRVAASKFKAFSEFGKATRGHICLQDREHGGEEAGEQNRGPHPADTASEHRGDGGGMGHGQAGLRCRAERARQRPLLLFPSIAAPPPTPRAIFAQLTATPRAVRRSSPL